MNVENIHETKLSMSRKTSVSTAAAAAAINSGRNSYAIFKPIHYKQQSNEKLLNQRRLSKHSISRFKLKSINDEFESFPFEDSIIIDDDNADDDDDDNDSEASEPAIDDDDNNDIIMELSENEDSSNDDNNNNLKSMTKKRKLSSNQYCNDQQNEDLKHEQIKRPRLASSSSSS